MAEALSKQASQSASDSADVVDCRPDWTSLMDRIAAVVVDNYYYDVYCCDGDDDCDDSQV